MSFRRNVLANYASQIYVTLAGLLMVPVYVRYLGAEAYGLVGFFGMLQGWLQLVDMGLSGALSREVTRFRAGGLAEEQLNASLRALAALFLSAAVVTSVAVWLMSGCIAESWLKAHALAPGVLSRCISLMGVAASLRLVSGLYRGIINGCEKQGWLGFYNIAIATVRYLGVLVAFLAVGATPLAFFGFQLAVALTELLFLVWKAGDLLAGARALPCFALGPVRAMWRFSGALAFTSVIWIFISQTDKLILSKILPLAEYGCFTVAVMAANGINIAAGPISGALLPRLTYLATQRDHAGLQRLYRQATQLVALLVWPAAGMVAFFAEPLLLAWTHDAPLARQAAPLLRWYCLGNACLGMAAFQYYLQFAYGKLRLHMIGNAVFVVILIPGVLWASINYGAAGAGRLWFAENLAFLLIWTAVVHGRFAPRLHLRWLGNDVLPIAGTALGASFLLSRVSPAWSANRALMALQLMLLGLVPLAGSALASSAARHRLRALAGVLALNEKVIEKGNPSRDRFLA